MGVAWFRYPIIRVIEWTKPKRRRWAIEAKLEERLAEKVTAHSKILLLAIFLVVQSTTQKTLRGIDSDRK